MTLGRLIKVTYWGRRLNKSSQLRPADGMAAIGVRSCRCSGPCHGLSYHHAANGHATERYAALLGGGWERRVLVPSGLTAVVVPSAFRVNCQPQRLSQSF